MAKASKLDRKVSAQDLNKINESSFEQWKKNTTFSDESVYCQVVPVPVDHPTFTKCQRSLGRTSLDLHIPCLEKVEHILPNGGEKW